jgi:hypothetical protein
MAARPFWSQVAVGVPDECWEWQGARCDKLPYGKCGGSPNTGPRTMAHRKAWALIYGPIPAGMLVLHRCDNPPCCNPAHLYLGTHKDNYRDMASRGRWVSRGAHTLVCPQGHPLQPPNLVVEKRPNGRQARRCWLCHGKRRTGVRSSARYKAVMEFLDKEKWMEKVPGWDNIKYAQTIDKPRGKDE